MNNRLKRSALIISAAAFVLSALIESPVPAAAASVQTSQSIGSFSLIKGLPEGTYIGSTLAYGKSKAAALIQDGSLYSYDRAANTWTRLKGSRVSEGQALALLPDGKILVIGGKSPAVHGYSSNEIYDPASQSFEPAASLPHVIPELPHMKAVTLTDGKILVTASYTQYGVRHARSYLYDAKSNSWSEMDKIAYAGNELVMDQAGNVLSYGGGLHDGFSHGQYYNSKTQHLQTISGLPYVLRFSAAAPLADGTYMLAGGSYGPGASVNPSTAALIFLPQKNQWKVIAFMKEARAYAGAALLPDGRILVVGGQGVNGALHTTEIYNPLTGKWSDGPRMKQRQGSPLVTVLANGSIMVTDVQGGSTSAEILTIKPELSRQKVKYDLNGKAVPLRGKIAATATHFKSGDWIYRAKYMFEHDVDAYSTVGQIKYTRMYMVRENSRTGASEIVLDGSYKFLKFEKGLVYFIQEGYLKKMKLGDRYAEVLKVPAASDSSAAQEDSTFAQHAGMPMQFGYQQFDGEYVYAWWSNGMDPNLPGYPVRYRYTGTDLELLSHTPGTKFRGELVKHGDNLYYLTGNEEGDQEKGYLLHMLRKDGSAEKDLALVDSFQIYNSRIYYSDLKDPIKSVLSAGKLYSMRTDGSDKRLLSSQGAGKLYFQGNTVIFETFDTGTIMRVSTDGRKKEVLLQGNPSRHVYHLTGVTKDYLTYNKHAGSDGRWLGTYKLNLQTLKATRIES
ncbi:kelch repeat-containing protein [Paenibacillus sambharensis]|uniref:kelch repeat-containing protein n=1 Tax=Paenibacillus sambharensis TaxID=1803190 RepID=UPI0015E87E8A|nr:kelch repeat-containing protein [Paenibacillus sambharensis]